MMRKWKMTTVLMLVGASLVAGVAYAAFPAQLPPRSQRRAFSSRTAGSRVSRSTRSLGPSSRTGAAFSSTTSSAIPGFVNDWHRHPGLVMNMVITGSVTLERGHGSECVRETFTAGQGFSERTGDIVRTIAGPSGAEYYVVYVLPPDADATGTTPGSEPTPRPCT